MTTTAAGYGEHQAGGDRGEEGRIQRSTTTTGGPPSIATATAAAAKDDAAALDSTKIRKPYTITKQRERWTDEEHQKFLEALKLYGRAWRQIEEHVGTKTAVQIRSHAQKFFFQGGEGSSGSSSSYCWWRRNRQRGGGSGARRTD